MTDLYARAAQLPPEKRALLRKLMRQKAARGFEARSIHRRDAAGPAPLSFAQERLWFLHQLDPASVDYNLPGAMRCSGTLDAGALRHSVGEIVRRHEVLRTTFRPVDGTPVAVAAPAAASREELGRLLPRVDLDALEEVAREAELRRLAAENARTRFDLARGPLIRSVLVRLGESEHALLFTMHHIASDAWSMGVFLRELTALYRFFRAPREGRSPLPELEIQYGDYAAWQRRRLTGEVLERELAYWRHKLDDVAVLELPTDRPRPRLHSSRGASRGSLVSGQAEQRLERLARQHDATLFMVLLAAFQTLLGRYAEQSRVVVGAPVANRGHAQVEPLVGFFVNTLVLGADLSGDPSFRELLGQVRESALEAFRHQDLPFEKLVEELRPVRDPGHTPLFQVMLVVQNEPREDLELPGLKLRPVPAASGAAAFDLVLGASASPHGLRLRADYRRDLFEGTSVERLLRHFQSLLGAAAERPGTRLGRLPLHTAAERHQLLLEWNDATRDFADDGGGETLHALFEEVAARVPERTALVLEERRLSYRELDRRAGRLARRLRARGVAAEVVVGVALERSFETAVALLGVLKAGGAYLPLDAQAPAERLARVLGDAGAALVLTRREERGRLAAAPSAVAVVDPTGELIGTEGPGQGPTAPAQAANPAYVISTSGSTGRPKGVVTSHRGVVNTLLWRLSSFDLCEDDVILQNIAFTFDPSIWQIFGALTSGARLVLVRPGDEQDFPRMVRRMVEEKVTVTDLAPSMLQVFLEQGGVQECRRLRLLFAGAEALPVALQDRFLRTFDADLRNIYGPTETSIDAACWRCRSEAAADSVPIGRPVANKRLLVLDARQAPRPIGVPGELYIGGAGLARGYLGRAGLTAERFGPDPLGPAAGARCYRTGDLVRLRADGAVEFLGRGDRQVKVRGFRIELGEVEAALGRHPAIQETAVVARPAASQRQQAEIRLVAYYVPEGDDGQALDESGLRDFLGERLPAHMVPATWVHLEAMPRTASGKIDFQALPEARPTAPPRRSYLAPRSELERTIAGIWQQVLGRERVGLDDNFFDLGGHSLLLVRAHSRLQEALGREVPVVDLFNYPTIRSLARHLDPAAGDDRFLARVRDQAAEQVAVLSGSEAALEGVAILAMVGRFPGAASVEELWQKLCEGSEGLVTLSDEQLRQAGVPDALRARGDYVRRAGPVDGAEHFDAAFFDLTPRQAEVLDPQQRLFLEASWQALEAAGYDPGRDGGAVGVYAGVSADTYLLNNLLPNPGFLESVGHDQAMLASDKDFLATRVSYKLDLKGPSLTVQTACSTSLVAVHLAVQALLSRQCDMALAGGCSISVPQGRGYLYREGGTTSPDGRCRAFDADARGMVGGNGVGVVVLKRLSRALADGDPIRAVIRGTAVNNDGAFKVGYTAPSVDGQAEVIATAQTVAGVAPEEIGYVEAHGTGTPLGDPIEVAALKKVFAPGTGGRKCALGSIKTNIGHLDAAAGVAGLIKAALTVEHGRIPPSLHFARPNPELGLAESPFEVNAELSEWPSDGAPRRAGVSSFGIGGTNAHAVLEQPPPREPSGASRPWQLVALSARSEAALEAATERLVGHLEGRHDEPLADVAYTLLVGRRRFAHRRIVVARDPAGAAAALAAGGVVGRAETARSRRQKMVAFLFPGQGAQYAGMTEGIYRAEPLFRETVDQASEILVPRLGEDLRGLLYPSPEAAPEADRRLRSTVFTQPALFVVSYALARLWTSWGVRPAACLGHSIGEYVAATLAGVFTLEGALALVAARGRLVESLPPGAMLSVARPAEDVAARLDAELAVAAVNAPDSTVVSGPPPAIEAFVRQLEDEEIACRPLATSHAFHSAMTEPVLDELAAEVAKLGPRPPELPFVSNLTGTWIRDDEATDPRYWAEHLRRTVRFADGVATLLEDDGDAVLLEVGPGRALSTLVRRVAAARQASPVVVPSVRPPKSDEDDEAVLLGALGRLWMAGVEIDAAAFYAGERRRRRTLPTYPFERRRYWVEPTGDLGASSLGAEDRLTVRMSDPADWFYAPVWRESVLPRHAATVGDGDWLVLLDAPGLGEELVRRLREGGWCESGRRVVTVAEGADFAAAGEDHFVLHPGRRDGYDKLFAALGGCPSHIVHLWNVTADTEPGGTLETLDTELERGFYSLFFLARALASLAPLRGDADEPGVELTVVSDGLHGIRGDERLVPAKATLLGPVAVMPLEIPGVRCRSVDVVVHEGERHGVLEQLRAELGRAPDEPVVAWRGHRRWVRGFERVPSAPVEGAPRTRDGGVYLLTGGLGGVGLELARGLARAVESPRLVLVGRSGLSAEDPRAEKVRALEALGAEVLVLAGDVADAEAMGRVLAEVHRRYGRLHGVVHAAGRADGGLIALREAAAAAEVLAPKVRGTLVLDALLADEPLDFVVLCSSLAALFGGVGQVDYAAANAFLDAYAARRAADDGPTVAINWDAWSETGMALDEARRRGHAGERLEHGLRSDEGIEVFRRALADGRPQSIVSTLDLGALAERFARQRETGPEIDAASAAPRSAHARPDLGTPYAAPRNETEERVTAILGEVLGIDRVGIDDDFTELGGDSLLAVQVLARLRHDFAVELPLRALFEDPTVARLAVLVLEEQSRVAAPEALQEMLADLDGLSEEEVRELLAQEVS